MATWKNGKCVVYEDRHGNTRCGACCEPLFCKKSGDMPENCPHCGAPLDYSIYAPAEFPEATTPDKIFIYGVVNHFSSEDTQTFNVVNIWNKGYSTFEEAKAAADAAFAEDLKTGDHGETEPITVDNCTEFGEAPLYCVGEKLIGGYERYHNFYTVFKIEA